VGGAGIQVATTAPPPRRVRGLLAGGVHRGRLGGQVRIRGGSPIADMRVTKASTPVIVTEEIN
jgi:hypothetical protein